MSLRRDLEDRGSIFQTTMDSEVVLHLMARATHKGLDEALKETFNAMKGAFSMLLMTADSYNFV